MKKFHRFFCYVLFLCGIGHLLSVFQFYDALNFNAFWYASGVVLAFMTGLLNLLMNRKAEYSPAEIWMWNSANFLCLAFISLGFYVMREIKSGAVAVVLLIIFISGALLSQKFKIRK